MIARVHLLFFVLCGLFLSANAKSYYGMSCPQDMCCAEMCYDYCDGLYTLDNAYCYSQGSSDNPYYYMDCYCRFNAWGWILVLVPPIVVFLWVCAAIVIGCALARKKAFNHYEAKIVPPSEDSVVMFTALPTKCQRFAALLLGVVSCGFFVPFLMVKFIERFYEKFWFGGLQGEFHGDAADYCLNVFCVNNILSCFTCGVWVCCGCAHKRQAEWIDNNTSVRGTNMRGGQYVYLWRARPSWIRRTLTYVLSALTCGLVAPLFFVRNLKETLSQMRFGAKGVEFTSETDEYVDSVWAPRVLFNILTCGCYSLCGCAEVAERGFVDNHLKAMGSDSDSSSPTPCPPTGHGSLPAFSSMPYPSSQENAPLISDRPPPYQYGAPSPHPPGGVY